MADNKVPGTLESWGTQTKTARPESVGPHDVKKDQEDPANPGIKPEEGYKNEIGGNEASAGAPGKPGMVPPPGVIPATEIKPGAKRDAPPMTSLAEE